MQHLRLRTGSTSGFTLIELLVSIFIIAVLVSIVSANVLGARSKARDVKNKQDMAELRSALQLYYNDYQHYPGSGFAGCGSDGDQTCPHAPCDSYAFAAGGTNCTDTTIYMKQFPDAYRNGSMTYTYDSSSDEFRLTVDLENTADTDIALSQTRCPALTGMTYTSATYVVCEK